MNRTPSEQRDWYRAALEVIDELERHAAYHGNLEAAFAPWCALCAAVAEALNGGGVTRADPWDGPRR